MKTVRLALFLVVATCSSCGGGGGGSGNPPELPLSGTIERPTDGLTQIVDFDFMVRSTAFPDFMVDLSGVYNITYDVSRETIFGAPVNVIARHATNPDPMGGESFTDLVYADASGPQFIVESRDGFMASDAGIAARNLPIFLPASLALGDSFGSPAVHSFEDGEWYRDFSRQCAVLTIEPVLIPAGRFDAYRVACTENGEEGLLLPERRLINRTTLDITLWVHPRLGVLQEQRTGRATNSSGTTTTTLSERLAVDSRIP